MEFVHIPVMLEECMNGLNLKPYGVYFDGTLGFSVWEYIKKVGIRCILIVSIAMVIDYVAWKYLPSDFIGLVIIGIITLIVFSILTYFLGLTKNERNKVNNIINKTKRHFIFYEK